MKAAISSLLLVVCLGLIALAALSHREVPTGELGSTAGPVSPWNYECHNGVCTYYGAAALKTGTTTVCAIQSPAATSTLGSAVLRLDTASTSATTWDIALSTTGFSTTTALGTASAVAGGAKAYIVASTTAPTGIVAPNTYVVFAARGGISAGDTAGTGFNPVGACRASFTTTNF